MSFRVEKISVRLGGVNALSEVSFVLERGEILGLVGPNGAGKSTLINAISGYVRPTAGKTSVDGASAFGMTPQQLLAAGVARTFQGARLFNEMTVLENVVIPALAKHPKTKAYEVAYSVLSDVGLTHVANANAGDQPAGAQRLLGLARALAAEPTFLLLDEPAAGLNNVETQNLKDNLREIATTLNIGVLLVEHDMQLVMEICDHLHVLNSGRTIFDGPPKEAVKSPRVVDAYLGTAK